MMKPPISGTVALTMLSFAKVCANYSRFPIPRLRVKVTDGTFMPMVTIIAALK